MEIAMENIVLNGETEIQKTTDISLTTAIPITQPTTIKAESIVCTKIDVESSVVKFIANDNIYISNLTFSGTLDKATSNAALIVDTNGSVTIKEGTLGQNGYNCIEIGLNSEPESVLIENIDFTGTFSNNSILIFANKNNAVITLKNCHISSVSNVLRLSNRTNTVGSTVNIQNCIIDQWESNPNWAGLLLFQDYTSTTKQECISQNRFSPDKYTINFINTIGPDGKVINCSQNELSSIIGCYNADQVVYIYNGSSTTLEAQVRYPKNVNRYPTFTFEDSLTKISFLGVDSNEYDAETGFNYEKLVKSLKNVLPVSNINLSDPKTRIKILRDYTLIKYNKRLPLEVICDKLSKDENRVEQNSIN